MMKTKEVTILPGAWGCLPKSGEKKQNCIDWKREAGTLRCERALGHVAGSGHRFQALSQTAYVSTPGLVPSDKPVKGGE